MRAVSGGRVLNATSFLLQKFSWTAAWTRIDHDYPDMSRVMHSAFHMPDALGSTHYEALVELFPGEKRCYPIIRQTRVCRWA